VEKTIAWPVSAPAKPLNRLKVAHFADQNHVRVLAKPGAQGRREIRGIDFDFALIDEALFVAMQKFDGIFSMVRRDRPAKC